MKLEPLKDKKQLVNSFEYENAVDEYRKCNHGIYTFYAEDVKSAFNFYWTYHCNATRFRDEQPKHWSNWLKYLKEHRYTSFTDWLLKYAFQDIIKVI